MLLSGLEPHIFEFVNLLELVEVTAITYRLKVFPFDISLKYGSEVAGLALNDSQFIFFRLTYLAIGLIALFKLASDV